MTNETPNKGKIFKTALIALVVIYGAIVIGKNVVNRTGTSTQRQARQASESVTDEIAAGVEEVGFAEAQRRVQERSMENIARMDGDAQKLAAVSGFLGLENRFSEGYEAYCRTKGVESMPNLKRNVIERNRSVHEKAVSILHEMGMTEKDIYAQIIAPMKPQIQNVIDMELTSLADETGQTVKEICEALEETSNDNNDLDISNQRPDIVKLINEN